MTTRTTRNRSTETETDMSKWTSGLGVIAVLALVVLGVTVAGGYQRPVRLD